MLQYISIPEMNVTILVCLQLIAANEKLEQELVVLRKLHDESCDTGNSEKVETEVC
jgi:hypothetical protein